MSFTPSEGRIHLYKKQMDSPASFQLLWADLQALADAGFLDKKLTQLDPRHVSAAVPFSGTDVSIPPNPGMMPRVSSGNPS